MKLFGKNLSKAEIRKCTGSMAQIADIELSRLNGGGKSDLVRIARVRTGGGLSFTVILDRALDIGEANYKGTPVAWCSQTGYTHPAFYEADGNKWLEGFFGGLLTTCGLNYAGAAGKDNGKDLGLHGRISNIPAENVFVKKYWTGNDYILELSGEARETGVFGENLLLTRKLKVIAGQNTIYLEDTVENRGFKTTEHMIIYHMNFGYPLVSEDSVFSSPTKKIIPVTAVAEKDIKNIEKITPPSPAYVERVYHRLMQTDKKGFVAVNLKNTRLKTGVKIRYDGRALDNFIQWKMFGAGEYVMGLEPSNCYVWGRAKNREMGTLKYLKPGGKQTYKIEISVC